MSSSRRSGYRRGGSSGSGSQGHGSQSMGDEGDQFHMSPFVGHDTPGSDAGGSMAPNTGFAPAGGAGVTVYETASGGLDFTDPLTSDAAREVMLSRITGFWPKFSDIPNDVKEIMFEDFLSRFHWEPTLSIKLIRKLWRAKSSSKYREWAYQMHSSRKKHNACPQEIFEQFEAQWNTPEFKEKSDKNKENRGKNQRAHTSGSKSYADQRREMMKETNVEPTAWDIYSRTHKVRRPEGDVWVDAASLAFATAYDTKIAELQQEGVLITVDVSQDVYNSLVNTISKRKDRRPNAGNIPTKSRSSRNAFIPTNAPPPQQSSELRNMEARMRRLERQNAKMMAAFKNMSGSSVGLDDDDDDEVPI